MPKLLSEALAELGANVGSPIQEWTFNESVNIPAGSLSVGTTLELSEGGQDLVIADLINAQMAFSVNSDFDDSAGASLPTFVDYGAAQNTIPQPDFTTVITTNPITFTAPSTVVAPNLRLTDRITIKANGPVTNFRARVTDQATGLVIRYMPNKAAWDGVTAGVNLIAGDNTFFQTQQGTDTPGNFFLGFVPFVTQAGQTLDIEFIADAMDLLGTAGGLPYFATEIHDGPNVDLLASTDTLTNNFILRGGGNGIVQACTLDDIAGVFTDNDCDLIGVRPVADGTAGVELEDSGGIARQSWVYNDLTDTATVVFAAIGGADIVSTAGDLAIQVASGTLDLSSSGNTTINTQFVIDGTGETVTLQSFDTGGAPLIQISDSLGSGKVVLSYDEGSDTGRLEFDGSGAHEVLSVGPFNISSVGDMNIGNITSGAIIINTQAIFSNTGETLSLESTGAASAATFQLKNSSAANRMQMEYDQATDAVNIDFTGSQTNITETGGSLIIEATAGSAELVASLSAGFVNISAGLTTFIQKTAGDDTAPVIRAINLGTNGGAYEFHIGDRTPVGNRDRRSGYRY